MVIAILFSCSAMAGSTLGAPRLTDSPLLVFVMTFRFDLGDSRSRCMSAVVYGFHRGAVFQACVTSSFQALV